MYISMIIQLYIYIYIYACVREYSVCIVFSTKVLQRCGVYVPTVILLNLSLLPSSSPLLTVSGMMEVEFRGLVARAFTCPQ